MCHRIGRSPISTSGFGHALGLLAQPRAHPAREDDDRHPLDRGVAAAAHATRQRRSASSSPVVEQLADAHDALEARGEEVLDRQAVGRVGGEQLLDPALDGPLRLEAGQAARDLRERDAVGARVGAGAVGERDRRVGHGRLDHPRDVADLVVVLVAADVEGLVVDRLARRLERGQEAARDVLDVGERAPRRAVALHPHLAGRVGVGDEVVDDDVAAQARGDAVGGGVAQVDGAEVVVGERRDVALGQHLGAAVGRDRVERRPLVDRGVALGGAVGAARGGVEEARDAGLLGGLGEPHAGAVVDRRR